MAQFTKPATTTASPIWTKKATRAVRPDALTFLGQREKKTLALLASVAALSACTGERPSGFAATLPPPPPVEQIIEPANGAIFSTYAGYSPLHYGQRASRVGDLVTVVLTENTRSSKDTSGSSDRDGSINITPPSIGPFSFDPGNLNSGATASFSGSGDASQNNSLNGTITVTIAEVLPNGVARVRGEKLMTFSQGDEWVQLAGLVRLNDIGQDNRVPSTRLADARITYSGNGHMQRASRPGWLARFFNVVSPF